MVTTITIPIAYHLLVPERSDPKSCNSKTDTRRVQMWRLMVGLNVNVGVEVAVWVWVVRGRVTARLKLRESERISERMSVIVKRRVPLRF